MQHASTVRWCIINNKIYKMYETLLKAGLSFGTASMPSKRPTMEWKHLQDRQPTPQEIAQYSKHPQAIFIACGTGSGNLEVLDFDEKCDPTKTITKRWLDKLPFSPREMGLPIVRTISGGYHVYYRLAERPEGNAKLAMRVYAAIDEEKTKYETLIETRGHGGYVIAPSCAGYKLLFGDLMHIPIITQEQHDIMMHAAEELSEIPKEITGFKKYDMSANDNDPSRPGSQFNQNTRWEDILEPIGWKFQQYHQGTIRHLTRPGKRHGTSATILQLESGSEMFYVFTSNAYPFEPGTGYTKFGAYALLNHDGDFSAAGKHLYKENIKNTLVCK